MLDLDNLTEEERALWEKMGAKFEESFQEERKRNLEEMTKKLEDPDFFNKPKEIEHVTGYQREIIVKVNAEISTINDQNQLLDLTNIIDNYYHIPVPSGVDYVEKIGKFLEKFDQELEDCAIRINTNNESEE